MKCAMVILNYKDADRTVRLAQKCEQYDIIEKIVIVDNKSNDESLEKINKICNDKIAIHANSKNGGFAYGNNRGIEYLIDNYSPKYILFANTDTEFAEKNINLCIDSLENNSNIGLISTRMIGPDNQEQIASYSYPSIAWYMVDYFWLGRKIHHRRKQKMNYENRIEIVDIVRGSFMLFNTKALVKARMFDENTFLYCEELIVSKRLKEIGYDTALLTDCYYLHDHIENVDNSNIMSMKRLFNSRFYYMKTYCHLNNVFLFFIKLLEIFSLFEYRLIEFIKGKVKKS